MSNLGWWWAIPIATLILSLIALQYSYEFGRMLERQNNIDGQLPAFEPSPEALRRKSRHFGLAGIAGFLCTLAISVTMVAISLLPLAPS